MEGSLAVTHLEIEIRESFVHIECNSVLDVLPSCTGGSILTREVMNPPESEERLELKLYLGRSAYELIFNENLVIIRNQDNTFCKHDAPDLVCNRRDRISIKIDNIFMAPRLINISIAMDSEIESLATKDNALINRRKQQVLVPTETVHRNCQKAVVAARVAGDDGCVTIGTGLVGKNNLSPERVFQIDEFSLVEFQKCHNPIILFHLPQDSHSPRGKV